MFSFLICPSALGGIFSSAHICFLRPHFVTATVFSFYLHSSAFLLCFLVCIWHILGSYMFEIFIMFFFVVGFHNVGVGRMSDAVSWLHGELERSLDSQLAVLWQFHNVFYCLMARSECWLVGWHISGCRKVGRHISWCRMVGRHISWCRNVFFCPFFVVSVSCGCVMQTSWKTCCCGYRCHLLMCHILLFL